MIISCKPPSFVTKLIPLFLNNFHLDCVRSKARHIIGIIYQNFCQHACCSLVINSTLQSLFFRLGSTNSEILKKLNAMVRKCAHTTGAVTVFLFSQFITFHPFQVAPQSLNYVLVYKIINNLLYFPTDIYLLLNLVQYIHLVIMTLSYSVSCVALLSNFSFTKIICSLCPFSLDLFPTP